MATASELFLSQSPIELYITASISVAAFAFEVSIGIFAIKGMRNQKELHPLLQWLLIALLICALNVSLCTATMSIFAEINISLFRSLTRPIIIVVVLSISYFYVYLLAMLVSRLHLTYRSSIYQISRPKYVIYSIIMIFLFILPLRWPIAMVLSDHGFTISSQYYRIIRQCVVALFVLFFITGCALAVRDFIRNLYRLSTMRTLSRFDPNQSAANITLTRTQEKLIDVSARFLMLFCIAALSTILACAVVAMLPLGDGAPGICLMLDQCVSLVCIILQFQFAEKYYDRCCGFLDKKYVSASCFFLESI